MDDVLRQVELASQGILALSTQEQLGYAGLLLMIVGIIGLAVWCCLPERKKGKEETIVMAPPVQLKAVDKGVLITALTNGLEDRVMFGKVNKKQARRIYDAVGKALDIPELVASADVKTQIKKRRAYMNGSGKKPLPIPGPLPPQEIKPNQFKPIVNKEKVKSLFKPKPQATV